MINRIKYLWQLTSVYIFLKKEQPAAIINLVSNYVTLPQTDYQDSVTVASVVNPNFINGRIYHSLVIKSNSSQTLVALC